MNTAGHLGNTLFYGDNLPILRDHIDDESVDLVYLDPPFNSNRNYNVLYKDESGKYSDAQIEAFGDTWHWSEAAEQTYYELWTMAPDEASRAIVALRQIVGTNQVMAYLVMMAARLVELHKVLKPTGSIYLHCDPTASHYLKILVDAIFGPTNFRNEIIWKRTSGHSDASRYGSVHDTILYYAKGENPTWNKTYQPYDQAYVDQYYRYQDPNGRRWMSGDLGAAGLSGGGYTYEWKGVTRTWRVPPSTMERLEKEGRIYYTKNGMPRLKRYLDESKGLPVQDVITDIEALRSWHQERLGYPTQKPMALLERIVNASSNPGDVVLDPFCGCGTTVAAAQKLGRAWIGMDITHLGVALQKYRLGDMFPDIKYKVIGEPKDLAGARQLASEDRHEFQYWAGSLIYAKPRGGKPGSKKGKKGPDKNIDAVLDFDDEASGNPKQVLVQVKSGHNIERGDIEKLRGTIERENAAIGVFITLEEPSKPMRVEAASAGFYHSPGWGTDYPRLQILTVEELLNGAGVRMPPQRWTSQHVTFKKAQRVQSREPAHPQFELG